MATSLEVTILCEMLQTSTSERVPVEDIEKLAASVMAAIDKHTSECSKYSTQGLGHEAGHVWVQNMLGVLRDEEETQAARIAVCKQLLALGWRSR